MIFGKEAAFAVLSYGLGCIVFGYYLVRIRTGQDLRSLGSGSAGGRNVFRTLGVPGGVLTLLGDASKGAIAVWAARSAGVDPWALALVMVAAMAGHIWPVQLGFRGGKGLATAGGALLVFDYRIMALWALVALVAFALTRRLTASGLFAVAMAPGIAAVIGQPPEVVLGVGILALVALFAHRSNIRSILRGARHRQGVGD